MQHAERRLRAATRSKFSTILSCMCCCRKRRWSCLRCFAVYSVALVKSSLSCSGLGQRPHQASAPSQSIAIYQASSHGRSCRPALTISYKSQLKRMGTSLSHQEYISHYPSARLHSPLGRLSPQKTERPSAVLEPRKPTDSMRALLSR